MSDFAIRVEGLGKHYQLGARESGYTTLRETLAGFITNPLKRFKSLSGRSTEDESFWALRDISFELKPGEVVGIIGHNGAGKSTILKILSQITEPTEGRVEIMGRIGSLLEVGTGFHPELTGRKKIFVHPPVKRYSSGMSVRLAFSVAAHLDPEILIVDEVLAVGDQAFQNKCLGKMSGVAQSGRTILFVSHQMAAVEAMCTSAIWLSEGRLRDSGPTSTIVERYLRSVSRGAMQPLQDRHDRQGTGEIRFKSVSFSNGSGESVMNFQCGAPAALTLQFETQSQRTLRNMRVSLGVENELAQRVLLLDSRLVRSDLNQVEPDGGTVTFVVPKLPLLPGCYRFTVQAMVNGEIIDCVRNAGVFYVEGGNFFGTGQLPAQGEGLFAAEHEVHFQPRAASEAAESTLSAS